MGVKGARLSLAAVVVMWATIAAATGSQVMTQKQAIVSADTPLAEIRDIFSCFHTPANVVQIQVASDETLYAWQNMSAFRFTMQILRDGPRARWFWSAASFSSCPGALEGPPSPAPLP